MTNLRHSPRSILARSYTCRMLPDDVSHSLKKAWIVKFNSRFACSPNPASLSAKRKLATARTFVSSALTYSGGTANGFACVLEL